jgi:hypothetical protein
MYLLSGICEVGQSFKPTEPTEILVPFVINFVPIILYQQFLLICYGFYDMPELLYLGLEVSNL